MNTTQNTKPSTPRDYDKNPIVIVDYLPVISLWIFVSLAILPLIAIVLHKQFVGERIDWSYILTSLFIIYIPTYSFLKNRVLKKRMIVCYDNKIVRQWGDELLEISLENIVIIKKSFIDYYDKKQEAIPIVKPILFLLSPLMAILHIFVLVIKYVFKKSNNFSYTPIMDTLVVFSKDDAMIGIFISNTSFYEEIKEYFLLKGYDLATLAMFYTTLYSFDPMTNNFNK